LQARHKRILNDVRPGFDFLLTEAGHVGDFIIHVDNGLAAFHDLAALATTGANGAGVAVTGSALGLHQMRLHGQTVAGPLATAQVATSSREV
jgi:hypothetical protein